MTDSQYLFVVLTVVYLLECVAWVHAQAVAIRWRSPGRGAVGFASGLGNPEGGLTWKPLIPALGNFAVTRWLPISISSQGLFSFIADAPSRDLRCRQAEKYLAWSAVKTIHRHGKHIVINGSTFVTAGSVYQAAWLKDKLLRLVNTQPDRRETMVCEVHHAAFDISAIKHRLIEYVQAIGALRYSCLMLFVWLFVLSPILVVRFGAAQVWVGVLVAILVLEVAITWTFLLAHRALHPQGSEDLWIDVVSILLNPAAAMRACDRLSRDLFFEYHPMATAYVLGSPSAFRAAARTMLVDMTHPLRPICPDASQGAVEVEGWSRHQRLEAIETFLTGVGVATQELLRPEPAYDASARSYCPRCQRHFEQASCLCDSCGGIPSLSWDESG